MIGRKALTGLSLLCALVFCAFAAPSAFAATSGTTAFTCVPVAQGGTNDYEDAHCDNTKGSGGFGHLALAQNPTGEVTGTNAGTANATTEKTSAILKTTAGGLETEIICTDVDSTGTLENSLVGEEHKITGSGINVTYTGCTVPKPTGQGCTAHSGAEPAGTIVTEKLKSESVEPMGQKFTPAAGTVFVEIIFAGCKTAGLNKGYKVEGSATAGPSGSDSPKSSGATLIFNIAKAPGSPLTFATNPAGLTQIETVKMEGGNPIVTTAP
jgi:hypothetical protein